ncbi:MAG: hypothetical protein ACO4AD_07670, partial [Pseudomonadales bacterium]
MSDGGRAQILGAVRRALKARSAPSRPAHLVPQRARLQAPELRALFVAQAEGAGAKVQSVADDAALTEALRALAAAHGGVPVVAPASPLAKLPWGASAPALRPVASGDA